MGLFSASNSKAKAKDPALPTTEKPNNSPISRNGTTSTMPSDKASRSKSVRETSNTAPLTTPKRSATTATSTTAPSLARKDSKKPSRPPLERRGTTVQTRYVEMLLSLDQIPRLHNIYAAFFTWVLLAGYIVFPATFTSLKNNEKLDNQAENASELEKKVLGAVRNAPLLYVAAFCCGIGCLGCIWLWWRWRKNYVWVINRIFLPALMNSIAGLISTVVNIYSAQEGQYSVTAKITIIVTAVCSVITAGLFLLYNNLALTIVKKKHEKQTREGSYTGGNAFGRRSSDDSEKSHTHGIMERVKQKANQPALEPSSVV